MANDSQRDKARAIFGKTFFENSKALPNPKNAAAALQKRANARPIPTYKVGGVVKKNNGGAMSGRNTPEADDVLITTARGKRMLEEQKRREAEKAKAEAAKRARADKLLGIPAQKNGGKAGCYADGGKAMAGAKRAAKAERDFSGLMMDAAKRAAAKGTPVMKDGGPTDEYTAKRVMSRIKAGNYAEGGEAKDRMEARLRKVENAYKVALAKGKNEGIAKAKFERKKADIADDYAKKTGADRTATKAAEQSAKATLREARRTKGASMAKREFDELMAKKGSQSVAPKTVDVGATLKGLGAMPSAEAPKAKAATVTRRAVPVTRRAAQTTQTGTQMQRPATPATAARPATPAAPAAAARPAAPAAARPAAPAAARPAAPAAATRPKDTVRTGRDIIAGFLDTSAREKEIAKGASRVRDYAGERNKLLAERKARQQKMEEYNKIGRSQAGLAAAASANRRFAAGGAAKVRKGMMKGK